MHVFNIRSATEATQLTVLHLIGLACILLQTLFDKRHLHGKLNNETAEVLHLVGDSGFCCASHWSVLIRQFL